MWGSRDPGIGLGWLLTEAVARGEGSKERKRSLGCPRAPPECTHTPETHPPTERHRDRWVLGTWHT